VVRSAQANVNAARAAQDQAEWRLSQRTLVAPRDGAIVDTLYTLGEFVPQGGAVATLLPPDGIKVRFFVPEPALAQTHIGDTMHIACDGCPADLSARVSYIAPQAEYTPPVLFSRDQRAKLVFMVEARPSQPGALRAGMPVEVSPAAAPALAARGTP
jgi:HlyD family secretion protein